MNWRKAWDATLKWCAGLIVEPPVEDVSEAIDEIDEYEPAEWQAGFNRAVFLDFDGVLHRGNSGTLRHLPALEEFLGRWPEVGVVVVSDWRLGTTLNELKGYFSEEFRPRVFARTGAIPEVQHQRQKEVEDLAWSAGIDRYLVIDDDPDLYSGQFEPLILTDPAEGLTTLDFERIADSIESWNRTI